MSALLYDQQAPGRPPTRATFVRRRAVALGCVLGLLLVLFALVSGDSKSPLGASLQTKLTASQRAQLPWRQRYASGSAGPLDARGLPSAAAQAAAVQHFYRLGLPIYCGGTRGNYATITFDDGPSQYSQQIMQLLERAGAQTTYFLIGENAAAHPDVPRQQLRLGGVADHTWTHPFLTHLSTNEVSSELMRTKQTLERETGQRVTLMRPPYGARDPRTDHIVHRMGLLPVLWDSDTRDSAGDSTETIVANATAGLRPGGIVLMHETYDRTLSALPQVLAAAKRKGLRLVSIPQLLALDPPPEAQVQAGEEGCSERERFAQEEDQTSMRLARDGGQAPGTATNGASSSGAASSSSSAAG